MKSKQVAKISAIVFLVIAIMQIIRVVLGWPAIIADFQVPIFVSLIAIVVAGYLAYENWKMAR